jgi:hypothetical protein
VTAPFATAATARLLAVSAWDVPLLRRAVGGLAGTFDRLRTWRARLEAVGRSLESGDCWSGAAAGSAVAALYDLSAVTSAVDAALSASLSAYERLVLEADTAQALAAQALGAARAPVPDLDAYEHLTATLQSLVPAAAATDIAPPPAAGDAALRHAAVAAAAAAATGDTLAGLGVRDAFVPAVFGGLLARVPVMGPFPAPLLPAPGPPDDVAAWWSGLSAAARLAAIARWPAEVGALEGLPSWARDQANRVLLDRALRDPRTPPAAALTAGVVARRIAAEESAGQQVQLHLLDLAGDRVVLGLGDLDTAEAVAVLVPGIGNSPADDLAGLVADARHVGAAARAAAPGMAVATAVWLGYRPPATVWATVTRTAAWRGGPALAASLAGLAAARTATGTGQPRTTVVAHSYGTLVVDEAADVPGILAADAVVLLGSPGMEDDAASLEAPVVVDAAAAGDLVPRLQWFGDSGTQDQDYGATELPVEPGMGHSDYYDPSHPTLAAIGEVVTGLPKPR